MATTEPAGPNKRTGVLPSGLLQWDLSTTRAVEEAPKWLTGSVLGRDLSFERRLGAGGVGEVVLVRDRFRGYQYAVKRAKVSAQDNFLAYRQCLWELQTWADLSDHPSLVGLKFFRTLPDGMATFSEYVSGGSLADWIADGRLYEGGPKEPLKRILDIAIQLAWGIDLLHEQGLVHRDVKPANKLLTLEGEVKISDFGLSRSDQPGFRAVEEAERTGASVLSQSGHTPAYRSPEQAEGRHAGPATDVWSWAVTVLEMFYDERPWARSGGEHAASWLEPSSGGDFRTEMPVQVRDVLASCLVRGPEDRPESLKAAAEALANSFSSLAGENYCRERVPLAAVRQGPEATWERRTAGGATWQDPRELITTLCDQPDLSEEQLQRIFPPLGRTHLGWIAGDIVAFAELGHVQRSSVSQKLLDEATSANSCSSAALVHGHAGDGMGELLMHDTATEIRDRLVASGHIELEDDLAIGCVNKGNALRRQGDLWGRSRIRRIDQRLMALATGEYRTLKLGGLDPLATIDSALRSYLSDGGLPPLPIESVADG